MKADVIVAVSDFERSLLLERFRLDGRKVVVIPNGVNFAEFNGLKRCDRGFRSILHVGRLEEYKGVHYLVEIMPKLPDDVVLEIVGGGSLRGFLERRAKQLGVYDRIKFYQNLQRRDLLQLYLDADVFASLSRHEAYGLAVAEALIAGTPCVVANTSGLSEWVDNQHCFGVDYPIRISELAHVVNAVLDRTSREVTNSGKIASKKILDWETVACRLQEIYVTPKTRR